MKLLNSVQKAQLKSLITVTPGLRTIQLVDRLDLDFEAVEDALSTLVDAGAIVQHNVIAPNNRPAKAYTLTGVQLPVRIGGTPDATAPTPKAPEPTIPVFTDKTAPGPQTKVARAIAYIKQQGGRASGPELANVLDLKRISDLKAYLRVATADGRVKQSGEMWLLGDGKPVEQVAVAAARTDRPRHGPVTVIKPAKTEEPDVAIGGNAPAVLLELPPENAGKVNESAGVNIDAAHHTEKFDPKAPLEVDTAAFLAGSAGESNKMEALSAADHAAKHGCSNSKSLSEAEFNDFLFKWRGDMQTFPSIGVPAPMKFANPFDSARSERNRAMFGAWSDGSLHIVREGEPACVLSPSEVVSLLGYILKFHPAMTSV